MSFWGALVKIFSRSAGAAVAGPVRAVTGAVKDLSDSAKDVTGIRRDLVETKLAEKHLADEGSLIVKPRPGDVEKYDPKVRRILDAATADLTVGKPLGPFSIRNLPYLIRELPASLLPIVLFVLLLLLSLAVVIIRYR